MRAEFLAELKENLLKSFRDEESYGFLKKEFAWHVGAAGITETEK